MTKGRSDGESEFGSDAQVSAAHKHSAIPKKQKVTGGLDTVIRALCAPAVTRESLLELFDNRASYEAIKAWRFGWRRAPLWACELLKAKIRFRAANWIAHESTITPQIGYRGSHGKHNLAAWRERKARERDAKEKAPD